MTKTLSGAMLQIQAVARAISGVKSAPDQISDSMASFPFVVTFPRRLEDHAQQSWDKSLWTVYTEIHVARGLVGDSVTTAAGLIEDLRDGLNADPTLNGTVDTIVYPIVATFGELEWGSPATKTIGWRCEITFKINTPD